MPDPEKKDEVTPETPVTPPAVTPEDVKAAAGTASVEAVKAERERVAGIMAAANDYGLAGEAQTFIADGSTVADARAKLADKKIAALQAETPGISTAPPAANTGAIKAFEDAVAEKVKSGMSKAKAFRAAIVENGPRHEAYLAAVNANKAA